MATLGRDPELKYAANGNAIANLNVATSEKWTDKATGQKQEKTEWHRVVIFGKLAEIAGQYLTKGSQVFLEGKLQTRKWQDTNTGQDRYSTEVVIDFNGQMQMLGGGNNNGQQQGQPAPQNTGPNNAQNNQQNNQNTANNGGYGQGQNNNPDGNFQQPPQQNRPAGNGQVPHPDFYEDDEPPY